MTRAIVLLLAVMWGAQLAAADEVAPTNTYAWHFPLEVEPGAEFLAAELPLSVYRSVTDSALRDIGVYNASGVAVPRLVSRQMPDTEVFETRLPLGMVPLYGEVEESDRRLRLLMKLHEAGTTLEFNSSLPDAEAGQVELNAVIADLREYEGKLNALEFVWSRESPGFIGRVTIEDSADLASWRSLAHGTLADLEFQGTHIEQRRIEIGRQPQDYVRVRWNDMPQGWKPETLVAVSAGDVPEMAREWLELEASETSQDGRSHVFDLEGYPPVDRLQLVLDGNNTVVRATLEARHNGDSFWQATHHGLFYRVTRAGNEVTAPAAEIAPTRAAQWKVQIVAGQLDAPLRLRLGWKPERLLFLAQGDAPFTLATGRAHDRFDRFPQQRLMGDTAIFDMLQSAGDPGQAHVGARQQGAGGEALVATRPFSWKTAAIWAGLIIAVGFVAWLVVSLLREERQ